MSYSIDLRQRVVDYVHNGGSKAEASRRFCVSRSAVYEWLSRDDLTVKRYDLRAVRKLDRKKLKAHVDAFPDMMSVDRARHFGVAPSSLSAALKQIGVTRKKSS